MLIHHLNCATMCPYSASLINGEGGLLSPGRLVCHCVLIETNDGLVLVDTGIGLADIADPRERLGRFFLTVTRPRLDTEETAARQIERLGFKTDDVRHIVLTHLDLDHAGGISDFPKAKIHVFDQEYEAAMKPKTLNERNRYHAIQWKHGPAWVKHSVQGEKWFGFDSVHAIEGVSPEVLLVPVVGHTRGHCAVAVDTPQGWLLHCGDAYFYHGEMDPQQRRCTPGLEIFQHLVQVDKTVRLGNQERLRLLARDHSSEVKVFCAHDAVELSSMQKRQQAFAGR